MQKNKFTLQVNALFKVEVAKVDAEGCEPGKGFRRRRVLLEKGQVATAQLLHLLRRVCEKQAEGVSSDV